MAKLSVFASFTVILILTLLFVNCTEDSPTTPSIDFVAPYVEWVNPSNSEELSGTVEFSFSVYDENGIDSIKLYINGALFVGEIPPSPPFTKGGMSDLTSFKKGGKVTSNTVAPLCKGEINDIAPPFSKGETPKSVFPISKGETSIVSPISKDETGIVSPFCKGGIKGGFYLINSSDTTITIEWNTLDYEDGVYILEARAWDTSGNLGTSPSLMVNVKNNEEPPPEDRTPPVVNWVSPEPGTEVDGIIDLQFDALDNIAIDNVKVYINGALPAGFTLVGQDNEARYGVIWHTQNYPDGVYDIEVRAFDAAGNVGSAPAVNFTVLNNRASVIWVPDDYETIQDAINASEDGDTVRVRAGIYYGMVYFWDKDIWLESEMGPELTIIDADNDNFGILVDNGQDTTTTVRGFTIKNAEFRGIDLVYNSSIRMFNNIVVTPEGQNVWSNFNRAIFVNNIFTNSGSSNMEIWVSYGYMYNNLIIHSARYAMFNRSFCDNPLFIDYNLFWDYQVLTNDPPFRFEDHNIFNLDPRFTNNGFLLRNDSPCIDTGHPEISDLDGSRSDMGVYGGQYAYPPP